MRTLLDPSLGTARLPVRLLLLLPLVFLPGFLQQEYRAAEPKSDVFETKVLPFLNTYCVNCHNSKTARGELNLTRFKKAGQLLDDFRQWEHVVSFMKKKEMPPAKAKQPPEALRTEMIATLEQILLAEARKLAGDPGVVAPRRLTNAEYNYSIQDLTGVEIAPAKSFPIDPASGEGFSNTAEALTMSPSLFKKYYAAAEFVSEHALLTTKGLQFAPFPAITFADRQKYYEQAILRFYDDHQVPYEKYFTSLWLYQYRPVAMKSLTVEQWAKRAGLSPKYSRQLWDTLNSTEHDPFVLGRLRAKWATLPKPKTPETPEPREISAQVRALSADIERLSQQLCPKETPAIVANAGNGPIEHLARRRRTAQDRDTFANEVPGTLKTSLELTKVSERPTIRCTLQLKDVESTSAQGYVIVKAGFTTRSATTDNKRKWTLRELLAAHAPKQLAKLSFGSHSGNPKYRGVDADSFVLKAPGSVTIELPTNAFSFKGKGNLTLEVDCKLDPTVPGLTSVQLRDDKKEVASSGHPLVNALHPLARQYETSARAFCRLFPNRFYYVDNTRGLSAGFHLIEGFFRDDQPLCRSVLSDEEKRELDQLWQELYFATGIWEKMLRGFVFFERSERNFLKHTDFDPFREEDPELVKDETLAKFKEVYLRRARVTAKGEDLKQHPINVFFEEVREGLKWHARTLQSAETLYLTNILNFAERAYRRPLTTSEKEKLEKFYTAVCRDKKHGIDAAVRASLVRILVSPHFCMRFTPTPTGDAVAPLSDLDLASRLSYFIWAGPPDTELLTLAKAKKLHDPETLRKQVRRMVRDLKVSRFAQEFFGQWLGYHDFIRQESVNRAVFPSFDDALRQAMFEEPTRLITHLIQQDRPITDLLNSDSTFVNKKLAQHYGLPFDGAGPEWQRITGLRDKGRAGLMGMAVFLTKNSQPQRTSPVKRGFWVVHKVLGEHIPPPPPNVAVLPAKETDTEGKTIRDLLKLHVEDVKCARCHQRFDPIGLAMEGFDPIGRRRSKDLAGRAIDNVVSLPDGGRAAGVPEFADYLVKHRKQDFTRTLGYKFLGYALGRSVALSDQPLLEKMQRELAKNDDKLSTLFELVVLSPQFRNQRCKDFQPTRFKASTSLGEKE